MTKTKQIFILLLASLLLLSGCGGGQDAETTADTTAVQTETEEETIPEPDLPYTTFEGRSLRFLYANDPGVPYSVKDIWVEGVTGEVVNDAVYERNAAVEEKFNIIIEGNPQNVRQAVRDMTRKEITAGLTSFDVMAEECNAAYPLALEGLFYNWLDLPHVNFDADWWDGNAAEQLSLRGKLFPMAGDITMQTSACSRMLYINKTMAVNYGMEVPYDDVRAGTWTIDKMLDMVTTVAADLNGDGVMDSYDQFGMLTENPEFFITGCGVVFSEKNDADEPVLTFVNENTITALEKINLLLTDKDHTLSYELTAKGRDTSGFNHIYDFGRSIFAAGQFLFVQNGANAAHQFAEMEDEYGILPNPKLTEAQEDYYHLVDAYAPMLFLPSTLEDPEMVGMCMEYINWLSSLTVKEAFYEITMKKKRANAPDDAEMLDISRQSCRYEITYIYDTGVLGVLRDSYKSGNLMSTWASREKSVNAKLEKLLDTIS